ncbi:MAG: hypothetical protein R3E95_00305 [Thiolinea sp.]
MDQQQPLWRPTSAQMEQTLIWRFMQFVADRHAISLPDYAALYAWSVAEKEAFWSAVWDFAGARRERGTTAAGWGGD